jgi:hypothetical protein
VQFQRSLSDIDRQLEAANAKYRDSSSSALRTRNLLALFDSTNEYEATLDKLYQQTMSVDQPRSDNTQANAWAIRARKVAAQRIISLRSANHRMVEAVDSGEISGLATEAIERARSSAEAKYHGETAALRRGYEALGASREDIPTSSTAHQ